MVFWIVIFSLAAVLITYFYYFINNNVFVRQNIPHFKPLPIIGNVGKSLFRFKNIAYYIQDVYNLNKDAKYVGFFDFFGHPVYIIRDPELVKSITVKNFDHFVNHRGFVDPESDPLFGGNLFSLRDEKWRAMRTLLSPAFTSSKMKAMYKLMMDCAKNFSEFFADVAERSGSVTVTSKDAFTRYNNDVIAKCAFGANVDSMRNPDNDFYILGRKGTNLFSLKPLLKMIFLRSFPLLGKIFQIELIDSDVKDFFYKLVEDTIKMRDETGYSRPDMIQLMMEARNNSSSPQLTIQEMTCQAFIFFFGGFETSSSLMCFLAHEIAANPEVQEKLQEEVDAVYEKYDENVPYDVLSGMKYLDAVIYEALRMYPIVGIVDRLCTKPFELPPSLPECDPIQLKPGDYVWLPVFPFQRDPNYFPEPDKFLPERFMNDSKLTNSPVYLSFGIGPRMCIGNRFALLENKVLLYNLVAKYNLKPGKGMELPLRLSKSDMNMTAQGGFSWNFF